MGDPAAIRDERWRAAIEAYRRGDFTTSLAAFPGHCRTEREVLQRLAKRPDDWEKAFMAVHPRLRKLYLSAFQSSLFDRVVTARLAGIDRIMAGDVAWKHDNGACFLVTDLAEEAPRAARFEISATGPMFGGRMKMPEGEPLALEETVLREAGLTGEDFARSAASNLEGARRPLRVPLGTPLLEMEEDGLGIGFALPRGSYATVVMREVMKTDSPDA
jgi:tRNA pseudouridine13 synthase